MEDLLERILDDANLEPAQLTLKFLERITDTFSDGQKIGSGGFAVVYKGLLRDGTTVAVKKFSKEGVVDDDFWQELQSLLRLKHKNIVQFLGYCADTQGKVLKSEGEDLMGDEQKRLLCFEFMPNGSLDKYITDAAQGLDWRTLCNIIKGICQGLHYLHQNKIIHLDLKPANILLDDYMVPKIADFGISRCHDENKTWVTTTNMPGTPGYMARELCNGEIITFKSDIFSLGTIILEMLTGRRWDIDIDNVLAKWSTRFGNVPSGDTQLEHVKACIEMGINCIDDNPQKRPTTQDIIDMLVHMDHTYGFNETDVCASSAARVLDVCPLDILFPFESDKIIKCPVTLINKTDDLIGVLVAPTSRDARSNYGYPYVWEEDHKSSIFRRLAPNSSETIYMTMRKREQAPFEAVDNGMFDVVMVAKISEEDLELFYQDWKHYTWMKDPLELGDFGSVVLRETLRVGVTGVPSRCQEVAVNQFEQATPDGDYSHICCMDVHPTKTWLLVGYSSRHVSIWNYKTQVEIITKFEVKYSKRRKSFSHISSIKFIAGDHEYFAVGDNIGGVHVYAIRAGKNKEKELNAHGDDGREVTCLAVYQKHTWLLTASWDDKSIKLWDWSNHWKFVRAINTDDSVYDLTVVPSDASIIASSIGDDAVVKVWDTHFPDDAIATFQGRSVTFYTNSRRVFLASLSYDSNTRSAGAKIWDFWTKKHIHTLCAGMISRGCEDLRNLASHPTLPILAGIMKERGSTVHHIVLWDVRTYRVVKRVELTIIGAFRQMVFGICVKNKDGTKDKTRDLEKHLKKKRP